MCNYNYDIIVIGGGCGGLTAAACAAKEGKSVLLLEKNGTVGGALSGFVRGRFEFDTSLRAVPDLNGSDIKAVFDELNISDKIQWQETDRAYRLITHGSDNSLIDAEIPFGRDAFVAAAEKYVPGSRRSVERLMQLVSDVCEGFKYISSIDGGLNPKNFKTLRKEHGNFMRTAAYSVDEVLSKLGVPKKACDIFNALWVYYGIDTSQLNFAQYALMFGSYIAGGAVPKNGGVEIATALAECVEDYGGEIRCNSPVERIIFENKAAVGVILKNGEKLFAKHIICNCSPTTAFTKLMKQKDVPESAAKRINACGFGVRAAVLYLGLNRSPEELGIKDYSVFITDTANTEKQQKLMKTLDGNNTVIAVCPNVIIPERSPQGTSVLTLTTLYTDNCWANIEPENYFEAKDRLASKLVSVYEAATGINIRDSIEELEVATPLTFARILGTPQGVGFGYRSDGINSLLSRISTESKDRDVNGLSFCGGWDVQLAGVSSSIASGRNCAYAALCELQDDKTDTEKEQKDER